MINPFKRCFLDIVIDGDKIYLKGNNSMINKHENQNGRSMIEMLGVLAIIGVLSVGGIAGYSKAMMKYRVNKTIDQISMISTNIRTLFGPQGTYTGADSLTVLDKAKVIPDEMVTRNAQKAATGLTNAFGGTLTVAVPSTDTFTLTMTNIPDDACITLLTQNWGDDTPIKVSDATNACDGSKNLKWTFTSGSSLVKVEAVAAPASN